MSSAIDVVWAFFKKYLVYFLTEDDDDQVRFTTQRKSSAAPWMQTKVCNLYSEISRVLFYL